jgi:hypothetical protein
MANDTLARQTLSFRDAKGATARTSIWIYYDSALSGGGRVIGTNFSGAVDALSNAHAENASGPFSAFVVPAYGTAATYIDVEDKAVLTFKHADGTLSHMSVPSPKAAIFLADGQTVDTANANVVTLVTNLTTVSGTALAVSQGKSAYTALIGGQRHRVKTQRRMTIYTKSGDLDEPAE